MKNIENLDWNEIREDLNTHGYSLFENLLTANECENLTSLYSQDDQFRKTINMARYRFGSGEYKYLNYPLPSIIQTLREELYRRLAPIANQWMGALRTGINYPDKHIQFIEQCHLNERQRPTPLMLKYVKGDYNTLHQDLYGEVYFPLQAIISLSRLNQDYSGGQLVLTEQVPRAQSKAVVVSPNQGDIVILTTQFRPQKGARGYYRVNMRHGVSEVTNGVRQTLGIIFHDSK